MGKSSEVMAYGTSSGVSSGPSLAYNRQSLAGTDLADASNRGRNGNSRTNSIHEIRSADYQMGSC